MPGNEAFSDTGGTCLGCLDKCFPEENHVWVICGSDPDFQPPQPGSLSPQPGGEYSPALRAPVFACSAQSGGLSPRR